MPQIPLERLRDNPFRDFELHPLDPMQVERLQASIDADGFWASVVARRAGNDYEIAYGHHRIAAAHALGWTEVPIEVRDLTDWQMVRMLASENATQRGSTAAACLDAVAAISKVLAYNLLRWDEARFVKNSTITGLSYQECRGRLEAGSGLGISCIGASVTKNSFTDNQLHIALGTLKDSGRMATIIAAARDRADVELRAEQERAEQDLLAAQQRETAARTKREREAAAKETRSAARVVTRKQRATAAAGNAVTAAKRQPITFDARCARLFKLDSHLATFRQIVTGETFQSYLPVSKQFEFAQTVLKAIRESRPGKEVTAPDIRAECWSHIETGLGLPKAVMRTAPERPYLQEIKDGLNFVRRGAADYRRGVAVLLSAFRKGERLDAAQQKQLGKLRAAITAADAELQPYREQMGIRLLRPEQEEQS